MAKKKEVFVPSLRIDWTPEMSEEERKIKFPRVPPPDWKDLKNTKGMTDKQKEDYYKRTRQ